MGTSEKAVSGLLLTPGAGSDRDHPTLVALEEGLAPLPVARVDFPYRKEGRRAPDRAPKLIASLVEDARSFSDEIGDEHRDDGARLALGGRSMGGRMCSMAVAEGLAASALVLLSYPLHPPGKPDRLRVDHFPDLHVPCLFVTGTRDPFGTPEELTHHTASIPGPVTHHWIDGARHDVKGHDDEIVSVVRAWLTGAA